MHPLSKLQASYATSSGFEDPTGGPEVPLWLQTPYPRRLRLGWVAFSPAQDHAEICRS